MPRPRDNDSASTGCRASPATTRIRATGSTWRTASSKACSSWARTRPSAAPNARLERKALAQLEVAGRPRHGRNRDGELLVRLARSRARRTAHRRHRDRSVPVAGRRPRREGRLLHQHAAAAAVAREGRRSARRRAQRGLVHVSPRAAAEGEGAARSAAAQRRAERADLGLLRPKGAHGEPDVEEILQEINGRTVADGKLVTGFGDSKDDGSTACGCWIYSGVYPATGEQSRRTNAQSRDCLRARLGLCVASRSPHPLQPRVGAARRAAVERAKEAGLVGRSTARVDRARLAGLHEDEAAGSIGRRTDAEGDDALAGDKPFIMHPDGVGWIWVPSGLQTARCRRTTSRSNRR